jgi:hypothetical protein
MVISLAKEDPHLVKETIARLKQSGEIESGDLAYLEKSLTSGSGSPATTRLRHKPEILGSAGLLRQCFAIFPEGWPLVLERRDHLDHGVRVGLRLRRRDRFQAFGLARFPPV